MKTSGLTIIELMIVIAIIAVIAVIAYPNYMRLKMESRRADAHSAISTTEAKIERYLAENNKANFDTDDLALTQFADYSEASSTGVLSKDEYYRITIIPDSTGYTVNATATIDNTLTSCNDSANAENKQCRDTLCRQIYIYHTEKRSKDSAEVESDATTTRCW